MRTDRRFRNGGSPPAPNRRGQWVAPALALAGSTLLYTAVLTMDADPVAAGVLAAVGFGMVLDPVIKIVRIFRKTTAKTSKPQSGRRKQPHTVHLKLVERDKDDRPTIH